MGNETSLSGGEATTLVKDDEDVPRDNKDNQIMLSLDRDYEASPTTKRCPRCPEEDNIHPLEYFTRYPCCCMCSDHLCRRCMLNEPGICGECFTRFPQGNDSALLWLMEHQEKALARGPIMCDKDKMHTLIGRTYILGSHTFLDELQRVPIYERLRSSSDMLSIMNPPCVQRGVMHLTMAAQNGQISAMLDLADAYSTNWKNDTFQKDKEKAEFWFQRAIGRGNRIHPIAITRYTDFLKWESRFREAQNMYLISATHGHARAQYEYAVCLQGGNGANQDTEGEGSYRNKSTNDKIAESIKWLCRASEKSHYIPSQLCLAKTLIRVFEEEYGTANCLGRSPLPRVLQILSVAKDGIHGNSPEVAREAEELLDRYNLGGKCANCGRTGSENNPLMACGSCGVVFYCSRVCMRRDFRDGHKFDCCSSKTLFDYHSIKTALPWTSNASRTGTMQAPSLYGQESRSLMQMVEDDTDEVYGEEELDYDEHILAQLMLRMRINLETYLERKLKEAGLAEKSGEGHPKSTGTDARNLNLNKRIEAFSRYPGVPEEFVKAMHRIRELGNSAAHSSSPSAAKVSQQDCEQAVQSFRQWKEKYNIIVSSEKKKNVVARTEAKDRAETKKEDPIVSINSDDQAPLDNTHKFFIANVDFNTTAPQVESYFARFGRVNYVELVPHHGDGGSEQSANGTPRKFQKHRGYGFLFMTDREGALAVERHANAFPNNKIEMLGRRGVLVRRHDGQRRSGGNNVGTEARGDAIPIDVNCSGGGAKKKKKQGKKNKKQKGRKGK